MESISKIEGFLALGDGDSGCGCDSGDSGDGSGYGSGYGYGGSGYGKGSGNGCGLGYVDGSGGYVDGSGGYGYGKGYGSGRSKYNSETIYRIDGVPTLIDHVRGDRAKGRILNSDLTTTECYIVKSERFFAHGKSLSEATRALMEKEMEDMPVEERLAAFVEAFPEYIGTLYRTQEFYRWHHTLTGSCEMGRKAFAANHGIDLEGSMTVAEFISLTEHDFGGEIISQLRALYQEQEGAE